MNETTTMTTTGLAGTKFQPPRLRTDIIDRPRLFDGLEDCITGRRLTLLTAPAGYGKTTLVSSWLDRQAEGREGGGATENVPAPLPCAAAWLALDGVDNDPIYFLRALIAALQTVQPAWGQAALECLSTARWSPQATQRGLGLLINDLLTDLTAPLVIVLDDYQRLTDPLIHKALDYLLERSPEQLRWVITSRRLPPLALSRLRARGQLAMLRATDLAFTIEETTRLLNEQLNLNLAPADVQTIQAQLEGWPAGLRLLTTTLQPVKHLGPREGQAPTVKLLPPPLPPTLDLNIFDYLTDEVLDRQPPDLREFLLQTAILPQLTPTLCQAVTQHPKAALFLEEVRQRRLFVMRVGPEKPTIAPPMYRKTKRLDSRAAAPLRPCTPAYRYHDLFRDFLRYRLQIEQPDIIATLHRRAAEAETNTHHKIEHYLAAEAWAAAAQIIEQLGDSLPAEGAEALEAQLIAWIDTIPPAVQAAHPRLLDLIGQGPEPHIMPFSAEGDTLTRREGEILLLLATGATNRTIAERLGISIITVKSHVTNLLRKLGVPSRQAAVEQARALGLIR